jgi:hypothetical protein
VLGDVTQRELPAFVRLLQTCEQSPALLLLRNMKKKLEHECAVACEVAFESTDVLEAVRPNVLADQLRWKPLPL